MNLLADAALTATFRDIAITVAGIAITILSAFASTVLPALMKKWSAQIEASMKSSNATAVLTNTTNTTAISENLKRMASGMAAVIADSEFPKLAEDITSGKLKDPADIKQVMYGWGADLKKLLIQQFTAQNVDIVEKFGDQFIENMVKRAAVSVSPFPGKDTAEALLTGGAEQLLTHGVDYVRMLNTVSPAGATPLPPAAAAAVATQTVAAANTMQPQAPQLDHLVVTVAGGSGPQ